MEFYPSICNLPSGLFDITLQRTQPFYVVTMHSLWTMISFTAGARQVGRSILRPQERNFMTSLFTPLTIIMPNRLRQDTVTKSSSSSRCWFSSGGTATTTGAEESERPTYILSPQLRAILGVEKVKEDSHHPSEFRV